MFKKVLIGSLAALMLVGVVMGAVSLAAPSSHAESQGGRGNSQVAAASSIQRGGGNRQLVEDDCANCGEARPNAGGRVDQGNRGAGRSAQGQEQAQGQGPGNGSGVATNSGTGRGQGNGGGGTRQGGGDEQATFVEQVTVTGTISAIDGEEPTLTLDDGTELMLGLGPTFYREEVGFAPEIGDEMTVVGFYEDGEFKVASVLTEDGDLIIFRDEFGRPMWAGRGRNNS